MSTTETKVRHSPLPWSVGHDGPSRPIISTGGHGMLSVDKYDERGKWSSYDNEEADCELIIRAVNSHADMLEALEGLAGIIPLMTMIEFSTDEEGRPCGCHRFEFGLKQMNHCTECVRVRAAVVKAQTAISKARGGAA